MVQRSKYKQLRKNLFVFNMFIVAKFVKSVVKVKYKSWNLIDAKSKSDGTET